MNRLAGEVGKMPREVWPMVAAHWSQPEIVPGHGRAPGSATGERSRVIRGSRRCNGIPTIVLSSRRFHGAAPERWSTDMRHIAADKSGHWIHRDQPELVVQAVRDLIV